MNKIINARCVCKKGLTWIKNEIIMLNPCEHLIHKTCFTNLVNQLMCPYCFSYVESITQLNDFKYNKNIYYLIT